MLPLTFGLALAFSLAIDAASAKIHEKDFHPSKIISKDVAIIGGGASGTYAAVRLREDLKTSVVVIEPKNLLGGHVATYKVPEDNSTIEYGVQSYMRMGPAEEFFARFGIETKPWASRRLNSIPVDINTGKKLDGYIPPPITAAMEAMQRWLPFVEKYEPLMEPGYWNFPEPKKIPEDLLTPFAETVSRLNMSAALPLMFAISGQGVGGFNENTLTLEMMQAFGAAITRDFLASSLFVPAHSNSDLYQKAYELLQKDVLLESSIKETEREKKGVRLVVSTKNGDVLIKAKRVLWTPYPSQENLKTFDDDKKEEKVFKDFIYAGSYAGVLHIPCIPEGYSVDYLSPTAVPANYLNVREGPWTVRFDSTGPTDLGLGLFRFLFSSVVPFTREEAIATINESVQKLVAAGTVNSTGACEVTVKAFANHNGVNWPQGRKAFEGGFVQRMQELQGYRSTWWTGRTWSAGFTSEVWTFTETVLQKLVKDLKGKP